MLMGAPLVVSSAAETEMSSSPLTTMATTRKEDVAAGKSSWKTRFSSPSEQNEELESNSLAQNRMQRFSKKGMTTAVHSLRRLLPIKGKPPMANSTSNSVATHDGMEEDAYTAVATIPNTTTSPRNNSPSNPQSPASLSEGNKLKIFRENKVRGENVRRLRLSILRCVLLVSRFWINCYYHCYHGRSIPQFRKRKIYSIGRIKWNSNNSGSLCCRNNG